MPKQGTKQDSELCRFLSFNRLSVLGDSKTKILILKSSFYEKYCHNGFPLDLDDHKHKNGVATNLF